MCLNQWPQPPWSWALRIKSRLHGNPITLALHLKGWNIMRYNSTNNFFECVSYLDDWLKLSPVTNRVNVWSFSEFIFFSFLQVILATNIAESSVTIPGVAYVIDSCRSLQVYWDPIRKTDAAGLVWISKSQVTNSDIHFFLVQL